MKTTQPRQTQRTDFALEAARRVLYRFAAISFLDPKAGTWERLRQFAAEPLLQEAADIVRREPRASVSELGRGETTLENLRPDMVLNQLPSEPQQLNEQYERTFGLLVSCACPPYETEYVNSKFVFQRSNALADIAGFYRAFGLETSAELPERHDHIVLELEFMAYVIGLEAAAAGRRSALWRERRDICRSAQRRFLAEHLSWWVPAFTHLLARQNPGSFYEAAGVFLSALIPADRSLLGVPVPTASEVKPTTIDRPEECEGCALAT